MGRRSKDARRVAQYLGRANGDELVYSFIVLKETEPIGYIQAWSDEPHVGGIDIVLIPAAQRQGFGPDAVRTLADYCRTELHWTEITVDPAIENHGAIRAFEKAGFTRLKPIEDERDGTLLLMKLRPQYGDRGAPFDGAQGDSG